MMKNLIYIFNILPIYFLILISGVYALKMILDRTSVAKNKHILLVLSTFGIIFSCALFQRIDLRNSLVGILAVAVCIYINQFIKLK